MIVKIEELSDVRVTQGLIYFQGKPHKVVGYEDRSVVCVAKQRHLNVVTLTDKNGHTLYINVDEVELAPVVETIH